MVRTIVSGVVHEIRSAADRGVTLTCLQPTFGTEDEPGVSVPKNGGDERTSGADVRRGHKNGGDSTSSRSRSASPGKRKSIAQDGYDDGFPSYEDGLSVLLRACEILGNSSNDQNTRQENTVHSGARDADSSPRKQVKSPAQSPQKASRNASPTRSRHEKPHGPCTNQYCLNPNESPQWRRGPPEAPILCNACGTRWLRSKQLIPIMPQRGIRYGKSGGRSPKKAPASPVKREGPVLDGTETQSAIQPDDKSITKSSEGNKSPVVKIIASI